MNRQDGCLESARPLITDLLTIRVNRDRFYYQLDTLFERRPGII